MAKKAEVIITCDASTVKRVLEGINNEIAKTNKRRQELQQKQQQGIRLTKQEEKELQSLVKYENALAERQQKVTGEMRKYGEVMKDLAGSKTKDLKRALTEVKQKLNNMSAKDPGREKLIGDMKRLQAQIDKNTGSTKAMTAAQKGFANSLMTTAKNLATYMVGFAGFNKVKGYIEDVFKNNLKLSDSLANIRKVSGLSSEAINQLYRNIAQIDSRNTIETLNQLAYTGAKLGIGQNYGVEGLTGFVKAAEQVQMALGEDMGEKALPELAKMTEVMGLIEKYGVEQSMQKAASAIFQLGATSTATGTNIVEFAKRLYGLANVSRVSSDELLALGSAADAMGLMPEVAATAFNKLFTAVQKNHNMIEKTLNLQPGLIKNYYTQGKTMEAIVAIFEKMNETGNLNLLGNVFKDLGSDGARLVNVMATMSDRVDILKKHLDTSRDAFKEGEAVIGEYMIQNQTAAAMLERASNLWAKAFTNPEGVDMVKELSQAWYDLSKQMTQSEAMMGSLHTSIDAIAASIGILIKLFPAIIRFAMVFGAAFGFKAALLGIGSLITGLRTLYHEITLATGAAGAFNVVLKSNAFLFAISAIATLVTLMKDYAEAAEEAKKREAERQAQLKASFEKSKETVENAIKPLQAYKTALDKANLSEKQRAQLVKDFKNDYQDYLDYLGIEINSAYDLAKAYAQVVKVMKLKKAYEERENYRTEVNGENRMERIGAQAKVEGAARAFGVNGIDKKYLEKNQWKGTDQLYREIVEQKMGVKAHSSRGSKVSFFYVDDKLTPAGTQVGPRRKVRYKSFGSDELYNAINEYIGSFRTERETNKKVDAMFNSEYEGLENFSIDDFNQKVQEARWKRKGTLDNEKPDKAALAAARKAAQEAKAAARKELKDAETETNAIIAKIEEWYTLQQGVITDAYNNGEITEQEMTNINKQMEAVKNAALASARRSLSGQDKQTWEKFKAKMGDLMLDQSDWSKELLDGIQNTNMEALRNALMKFDGKKSLEKWGFTSTAFRDGLNKNAAKNEAKIKEITARFTKQALKMVEKYQFIDVAEKKMQNDLQNLGIMTETYEQMAKRVSEGKAKEPYKGASGKEYSEQELYASMGSKFMGQGTVPYTIDITNKDEALKWINQLATDGNDAMDEWAQAFPDLIEWVRLYHEAVATDLPMGEQEAQAIEEAMPKIQALYYQLESYSSNLSKTIEQQVNAMTNRSPVGIEEMRAQYEQRKNLTEQLYDAEIQKAQGNAAAIAELEEKKNQALIELKYQHEEQEYQITEKLGATWAEQYEHELAQYQNMLDKKLISEKQFEKKKKQLQAKNATQYAQYYTGLMSNMVSALQEYEIAEVEAKYDVLIAQTKAAATTTEEEEEAKQARLTELEEQKEAEKLEIQKKYADMQFAVKASEIIANTAVAIMQAYAQLGPIGGSIAAAMLTVTGAMQLAIANKERERIKNMTTGSGSKASTAASSSSSSNNVNTKLRLGKGMLTYDKGNLYLGSDGRVYTATEVPNPGTGLVTKPIATTVQGQAALVAEQGPELVVGRETTRQIQMNEPELISYLADYDRQKTQGYRTYDGGNVSSEELRVKSEESTPAGGMTSADARALTQAIEMFIAQCQQPLSAKINMYGQEGLYEQHKKATAFMKRYGQ